MKTVRVTIEIDEWYPVYTLVSYGPYDFVAEIPKKKCKWLETTFKEFDKVQDYLRGLEDKDSE